MSSSRWLLPRCSFGRIRTTLGDVTPFEIVLLGVLGLLVVFIGGGMLVAARGSRARDAALREKIAAADRQLADARAGDQGWDPAPMEAAAREAGRTDGDLHEEVVAAHLVQVVDRPGTDADEAVFRLVTAGGGARDVRIHRTGDAWRA
jgi:hypothetical protein